MRFTDRLIAWLRRILPMPFTIAILLTILTIIIAIFGTEPKNPQRSQFIQVLEYWEGGFFNFLAFAMQMMLILVLGHVLALTRPVARLIRYVSRFCTSTAKAAFWVTFLTILTAYFNWGLGLIFGAIFARKVAEYAQQNRIPLNYPLIGAAGYSGLMIWHGGISGSAPSKVAEIGHEFQEQMGQVLFDETIFSTMNIVCFTLIIVIIPAFMYWLGTRVAPAKIKLPSEHWVL